MMAEGLDRAEPRLRSDLFHGEVGRLGELPGMGDTLAGEPLAGRRPERLPEAALEGPEAHAGPAREVADVQLLVEMAGEPVEQCRQPAVPGRARDGRCDELLLAAVPVRREHQPPGDIVRDGRAVVLADDVQAEIEAGGAAGRGEHRAFVHIEDIGVHTDIGIAPGQGFGVAPMSRRALPVEHAGGGEHEHARADRHQPAAAFRNALQRIQQGLWRRLGCAPPAGHDHRVGPLDQTQVVRRLDGKPAGCTQRPRLGRADVETVPGAVQLRPGKAEDFVCAAEFEGAKAVIGQCDDARMRRMAGYSGAILPKMGKNATGPPGARSGYWATTGLWKEPLMLRLYDNHTSGNGYKPRLLLAHLGIAYDRVEIDILNGESRTPAFLKKNPNGRIPVLELEDGVCLAESNAILFYLAEGSRFLPSERLARALTLQWMFFEQYSHEPFIAVARHWIQHTGMTDEQRAQLPAKQEGGRAALAVMEGHLGRADWFGGEGMTVADIALYAYTHAAEEGGFDLNAFPAVRAWLDRVAAEPGHVPMDRDGIS